jgi:hypothetical protein
MDQFVQKEVEAVYFKILPYNMPVENDEYHQELGIVSIQAKNEHATFQIQNKSTNH